jgi:hypothetical protein
MKKLNVSKEFLILGLLWSCISNAGGYVYSDLRMKDYDEMQSEVRSRITSAEQVADADMDDAKSKLKDALQLILSRPNTDNMVSQLVPNVRTPLRNVDAFEITLNEIATQAIADAKNEKLPPKNAATAFIILENLLSELKPEAKTNGEIGKIFLSIRDARIKVPDRVKSELKLRAMIKDPGSPSEIAEKIIGKKKK